MSHAVIDHRRRTIRLRGYDYAEAGAYFVTVVAQDRVCLFGDVIEGDVRLSAAGLVVASWWDDVERRFPTVATDAFLVMPNNVHGIAFLGANVPEEDKHQRNAVDAEEGGHAGPPLPGDGRSNPVAPVLGTVIQWFKTMSTNDYIWGVKNDEYPPFRGRLWQRNYYEHIIRSDQALARIRRYIADNPSRWQDDEENPDRVGR